MTFKNTIYWGGLCFLLCANCIKAQTLPSGFTKKLKSASVAVSGDTLIASTGKIERKWCLNQAGLRTVAVKDLSLNNEWGKTIPEVTCWIFRKRETNSGFTTRRFERDSFTLLKRHIIRA